MALSSAVRPKCHAVSQRESYRVGEAAHLRRERAPLGHNQAQDVLGISLVGQPLRGTRPDALQDLYGLAIAPRSSVGIRHVQQVAIPIVGRRTHAVRRDLRSQFEHEIRPVNDHRVLCALERHRYRSEGTQKVITRRKLPSQCNSRRIGESQSVRCLSGPVVTDRGSRSAEQQPAPSAQFRRSGARHSRFCLVHPSDSQFPCPGELSTPQKQPALRADRYRRLEAIR